MDSDNGIDNLQVALAGCGLIPVIGEPCDAASAVVSLVQEDHAGASLSGMSIIPFFGHAAGVTKIARTLDKINDAAEAATDTAKAVNGNSKLSNKAQHLYEIFEVSTDNVVKTGVSSGKISDADRSYRATSQVNKWNKAEGAGKYDSRIVKKVPAGKGARKKILKAEEKNAKKHRATLDPTKHKRP